MNTAQSGLLARDAGPGRTTVLCRSARALLARDAGPVRLVKQSTRALANRSSRDARVHTDRNGQVEAIAHLCSVRPPQRRAPPHETRAPLSAITVLGS